MTRVIAFVSQKGGVGKSTLARALAREVAKDDVSVKIGDLDVQQGTTANWHRRRLAAGIEPVVAVEAFRTAAQALKVRGDFDLLILDGPARASAATLEIAQAADLIVQPTGASIDDLEPAVLLFHELVREKVPKASLVFALCRVSTDAEESEARDYIAKAGYETLVGSLHERAAYRQAQNVGQSITETRFAGLNQRADVLIQAIVDRVS
ncbi:chromosome partitioning protein [Skermanella aerolata]|uniref:AAA family ATPase n=1 Tax=Skermanella aerolata TaxID=393310 RepID=UPI003D1B979E